LKGKKRVLPIISLPAEEQASCKNLTKQPKHTFFAHLHCPHEFTRDASAVKINNQIYPIDEIFDNVDSHVVGQAFIWMVINNGHLEVE
jgi:hypothetical protein